MAGGEGVGLLEIAMAFGKDHSAGSYLKVSQVDRAYHWPKLSNVNPFGHVRRKYAARS